MLKNSASGPANGHYLGETNALHPFREGNGRAQRAFIGQVAREAGYEIEWSKISREDMTPI